MNEQYKPYCGGKPASYNALVSYWEVDTRVAFTYTSVRKSLRDIDDRHGYSGNDITVKPFGVFLHVKMVAPMQILL